MNLCTDSHIKAFVVVLGGAFHLATLLLDYWLGKTVTIKSNSILELFIRVLKIIFKKKPNYKIQPTPGDKTNGK